MPKKNKKIKTVPLQRIPSPQQELTSSQRLMQEMFNDKNQTWGNGANPIRINGVLRTGRGLVNSGDDFNSTARMFGGSRR